VFRILDDFPDIGLKHAALPAGVRMHPVSPYPLIVFYERRGDMIVIIRVLHDRRRWDREMR